MKKKYSLKIRFTNIIMAFLLAVPVSVIALEPTDCSELPGPECGGAGGGCYVDRYTDCIMECLNPITGEASGNFPCEDSPW